MKICLLGAQGTGKSTLANLFRGEYKIIDNIVRDIIKKGGKSNQDGDLETQMRIFTEYMNALSDNDYISTRSVIDVLAYTMYLNLYKRDHHDDLAVYYQADRIKRWLKENPDVVICYIPIEFDIEDDGVRSINKEYQSEIDQLMRYLFNILDIKHKYTITGNLDERKQQLAKIIEMSKDF